MGSANRPSRGSIIEGFWLLLPTSLRLKAYGFLAMIGRRIWPSPTLLGDVQRLPFGLYSKRGPKAWAAHHRNEYEALQLVRKHTAITVPRTIDILVSDTESCLITSRIPGEPVGELLAHLTTEGNEVERKEMIVSIREIVIQLRSIRNPYAPEHPRYMCNAAGEALIDPRIKGGMTFLSSTDFDDDRTSDCPPELHHLHTHEVYFSHGDLNMWNILAIEGKISGVVDWEFSGWWPEYWEYTKAYYVSPTRPWRKMLDEVFAELDSCDEPYSIEKRIEAFRMAHDAPHY